MSRAQTTRQEAVAVDTCGRPTSGSVADGGTATVMIHFRDLSYDVNQPWLGLRLLDAHPAQERARILVRVQPTLPFTGHQPERRQTESTTFNRGIGLECRCTEAMRVKSDWQTPFRRTSKSPQLWRKRVLLGITPFAHGRLRSSGFYDAPLDVRQVKHPRAAIFTPEPRPNFSPGRGRFRVRPGLLSCAISKTFLRTRPPFFSRKHRPGERISRQHHRRGGNFRANTTISGSAH